jgi:hypothetical protein
MRKQQPADGSGDKGTLLPNTAIMLGSLQQGILNLQGQVSMGDADLSSQLTGVGENLSSQIDTQSAQWQNAFADLNTYLGSNFTSIMSSQESLATAISALNTQNVGLADSLTHIMADLYTANTGIAATQTEMATMNAGITAGLTSLGQTLVTQGNQIQDNNNNLVSVMAGINALAAGQTVTQSQIGAIGRFLGWQFYQIPNRYAAYIPGQEPGSGNTAGVSVIGSV